MKSYKNRTINKDKPVEVYRNLGNHVDELWSIRQDGLVVGHTNKLMLRDAEFIVGDSGRERVREEGKKNVHAFVRGHVTDVDKTLPLTFMYDPYEHETFITFEKTPLHQAKYVKFHGKETKCSYDRRSNEVS